jgi:hypothetical protein
LLFSPNDPDLLYAGGSVLFASSDQGQTWKAISQDLTRNDKTKQASSGGPITKDNTSVEYYDTIFTVSESPVQKGLLWVGSDDGLVHLTKDGGAHWENVTPKNMPEWIQINSIEASPFSPGTAYFAATMYKFDDNRPFLYKTTDFGKTWNQINDGIPATTFTRVVREDPNKKDLLYAGTETGMYVSFNGGAKWQSLQLNLPLVPIHDLAIHKREKELVAATHGRSFWILDDLPVLAQLSDSTSKEDVHLFEPKHAYRMASERGFGRAPKNEGANPPSGAVIYYWLKDKPNGDVTLEILDSQGKTVKSFSSKAEEKAAESSAASAEEEAASPRRGGGAAPKLPANKGLNRFEWDLHYPDAVRFPGMILWAGSIRGPVVVPGVYQVKLTVDDQTKTQKLEVRKDPRVSTTQEQYMAQLELELQLRDKLSQTHRAILRVRDVRKQIDELSARLKENGENAKSKLVLEKAKALSDELTGIEEALYQTKNRASEDPLNFPIRLNNKLAALLSAVASADAQPTASQQTVYEDVSTGINAQIRKLNNVMDTQVPAFNKYVKDQEIPAIAVKAGGNL